MRKIKVGSVLPVEHVISGFSMGFEHPHLYGHEKEGQRCLVWRRDTREVVAVFDERNAALNIGLAHDKAFELNRSPRNHKATRD